ncbi:hypothetical protein L1987_02589 [Smallanthus sonchifolius]|uniref:Uncharacterized protein n=1 Tax=Smallanthus sonchifolius TaxID=185202 RepID=A0ACB9K8E5_9ASTR|nr:hypothetical protein L1987_02589 [Smallanthus sonchifolius]
MASIETGAPSRATTETQARWSSKLTRYVSGRGAVAVKNQGKVDVALRAFLFVFSVIGVVIMVTSKQTMRIPVSPVMTMKIDAKFTHSASFTYFVSAFSVICLYSMITGYSTYSALKKQEPISINQQLQFLLLDSIILSIAASATGAAGGVAYEALKGNPHIHWMKICHIFDTFCHHLASAGAMSLLASMTILLLIWTSSCAIVRNSFAFDERSTDYRLECPKSSTPLLCKRQLDLIDRPTGMHTKAEGGGSISRTGPFNTLSMCSIND